MRRFYLLAFLACGTLMFPGCGGKQTQTANNGASSASSTESGSRPSRNTAGKSSSSVNSSSQKKSSSSSKPTAPQMSGDPRMKNGGSQSSTSGSGEMSGDPRMQNGSSRQGGSGGGEMTGDPRMQNGNSGEPQKPDIYTQAQWDKMSPAAKKRAGGLRGSGGGSRGSVNSGGANSGGASQGSGEGEMQGDPRSGNGGGGAGSASAPGAGSASAPGGGSAGSGRYNSSNNGGQQAAKTEPETLKDKSIKAFQDGDDDGGFQYMYGHLIAEDAGRKQISLQMLPSVKRPRTAIRWGVGVIFKKNKGFEGAPPKIGEQPNVLPQGRNSGGRNGGNGRSGGGFSRGGGGPGLSGSGGQGGSAASPTTGGIEELQYYTGEVGDVLLGMLEKLRSNGNFGQMIAQINPGTGESNNRGGSSRGTYSRGSGSSGMIDDGRTKEDLNRFRGGGSGGGFNPRNNSNKNNNAAGSNYKNLLPGVLMLGKATLKSLQSRAKAHGIDVLVVFEVNCKNVPSNGQKINDTKISLYDVAKSTPVRVGRPSTTLNNIRIWMTRQNIGDEAKDPVRTAVRGIFEPGKEGGFLEIYKIAAMPNLNPGQVMNRLKSLIDEGQASGNPMPALVELTYYRQKGLLPEKPFIDSVNKLAGSKIGETLLNGEEEDRVKAISLLLPPDWKVQESSGAGDGDDLL